MTNTCQMAVRWNLELEWNCTGCYMLFHRRRNG